MSDGFAQGPYMAARVEFEPSTLQTQGTGIPLSHHTPCVLINIMTNGSNTDAALTPWFALTGRYLLAYLAYVLVRFELQTEDSFAFMLTFHSV